MWQSSKRRTSWLISFWISLSHHNFTGHWRTKNLSWIMQHPDRLQIFFQKLPHTFPLHSLPSAKGAKVCHSRYGVVVAQSISICYLRRNHCPLTAHRSTKNWLLYSVLVVKKQKKIWPNVIHTLCTFEIKEQHKTIASHQFLSSSTPFKKGQGETA